MNIYEINCPQKKEARNFFEVDDRIGAKGFQEAPTLTELLERDKQRNEMVSKFNIENTLQAEMAFAAIGRTENPALKSAYLKAWNFERLSYDDGLLLLRQGELNLLGALATRVKKKFHPENKASFLIDRNINYTNVCRIGCDFCAFYRREGDSDAYVHTDESIYQKISETIALGGTSVLMQGGVNPKLKIEYYENLFRGIKQRFKIHLHALSIIEIEGIAQVSRLTVPETLDRLKAAGLDSIPGAGAEILVDEIRLNQSPVKRHSRRWIATMQEAHKANLPTTATMMFGALERDEHVIEHICRIRDAQDETQGFYSFIMWTFQGENTELLEKNPELTTCSAVEYLKVVAISRLMMDNIPNIQGSWVTMGPKIGQVSLHYGANDMGSIMIEENVVSAAGTAHTLTSDSMIELIRRSGFTPVQRDVYYNIIAEFPQESDL